MLGMPLHRLGLPQKGSPALVWTRKTWIILPLLELAGGWGFANKDALFSG
jgi:hypothetical protein